MNQQVKKHIKHTEGSEGWCRVMNELMYEVIERLEQQDLSSINLLALVTETSYEVIFYAKYDGQLLQSNDLAEKGIIQPGFVDSIYEEVSNIIRNSDKYDASKMNIIKVSSKSISVSYEDKNCRVYGIKKKWKEENDL